MILVYLIYVDESGDTGARPGSSKLFVLSALVVHELRWHEIMRQVIDLRANLRHQYGLKLREEIHAAAFVHAPGELARIPKSMRLRILRDVIEFEASLQDISIINILVDKSSKDEGYDVFENAWRALIQRFENTVSYRNFPGPRIPRISVSWLSTGRTSRSSEVYLGECACTIRYRAVAAMAIGRCLSELWSRTPCTGTRCTRI